MEGVSMNKTKICVLLLVVVLTAMALAAPMAVAKQTNPGVIPPQALPAGMSYGDWAAAWWQWALRNPYDANALNDATGAKAGVDQHGKAWFLAGTIDQSPSPTDPSVYIGVAERTCTVPHGKMIFFPIVNTECSTAEGNGSTEAELAAMCDYYIQHAAGLKVTVDGRDLRDLTAYRGTSGLYQLWWPSDPVLAMPAITEATTSVADGYWIMLAPLSTGKHVLHWEGNMTFTQAADGFDGVFAQNITYHLTVK
jgi:hypothetical protein